MTFSQLKFRAKEELTEKWNPLFLGYFISLMVLVLTLPHSYYSFLMAPLGAEFSYADSFLCICAMCIYYFINMAFTIAGYTLILNKDLGEKNKYGIMFISAFFNFSRGCIPVVLTSVLFALLNFLISPLIANYIYDIAFFSYINLYVYESLIAILNFVVPILSIYVTITFIFTPCILAETPFISPVNAMRLSKVMTKGQKSKLLFFSLSYIGWFLLGGLAFGIGIIFAYIYFYAGVLEYYKSLKPVILNDEFKIFISNKEKQI